MALLLFFVVFHVSKKYLKADNTLLLFFQVLGGVGFFMVGPVRYLLSIQGWTPFSSKFVWWEKNAYLDLSLIYVSIAYLIFNLATVLFSRYKGALFERACVGSIGRSELYCSGFVFIGASVFFIYSGMYRNLLGYSSMADSLVTSGNVFIGQVTFFFVAMCLLLVVYSGRIGSAVGLVLIIILGAGTGSKSVVVFPLLAAVFVRFFWGRVIDIKRMLGALLLLSVCLVAMGYLVLSRHSESIVTILDVFVRSPEVALSIVRRFYGVESIGLIIEKKEYLFSLRGELASAKNLFWGAIPSFVLPDKPSVSFGIFLSQTIFYDVFGGRMVAASGTMLGEGIVNGSVLYGYFFYVFNLSLLFFLALVIRLFDRSMVLSFSFLLMYSNIFEGELVGNTIRMAATSLVFVVASLIFNTILKYGFLINERKNTGRNNTVDLPF